MTPFEIEHLGFSSSSVATWAPLSPRNRNWPVVYVIDGAPLPGRGEGLRNVYVGETINAANRMKQHLENSDKQHLTSIRVILDNRFNKSVCLDLESYLIRLLAGDGAFRVLNRNDGIVESDYFERASYRESFQDVFDSLRADGMFTRSVAEIENSDLFKLSPFKALSQDQAVAVEGIVEGLLQDLESDAPSTSVVQGSPGTGSRGKKLRVPRLTDSSGQLAQFNAPDPVTVDLNRSSGRVSLEYRKNTTPLVLSATPLGT